MLNTDIDYTNKKWRCVTNNYASICFYNIQISIPSNGTGTTEMTFDGTYFPGNDIIMYIMPVQHRNATDTGYDYIYTNVNNAERVSTNRIKFGVTARWISNGSLVTGMNYWVQALIVSSSLSSEP